MDARMEAAITTVFGYLNLEPTNPDSIPKNKERIKHQPIPADIAETHGRLVTIALGIYGSRDMALRAIERAFETYAESGEPVTEWTNVSKLFPVRISSYLTRNGINTVMELCCFSREDLAGMDGGNRAKMAATIEETVGKYGFELRRE